MTPQTAVRVLWLAFLSLVGLASCTSEMTESAQPEDEPQLTAEEAREEIEALALDLVPIRGHVVDADTNEPVADATLTVGEESGQTDEDGRYEFFVRRTNNTQVVEAPGYRTSRRPLWLFRPNDGPIPLGTTRLDPRRPGEARFIFGGDVALGRRYLDPDEETPVDEVPSPHPEAIIDTSNPLAGTQRIFDRVRPMLSEADFASVNLESAVTDDPRTPAEGRRFIFFSLPDSLPALAGAGIDHVALANNHTFDYGSGGLSDTLANVENAGLGHCGLGDDEVEAFTPYRTNASNHPYSIVSLSNIETGGLNNSWSASENQPGTADLTNDERVTSTILGEVENGSTVVSHVHTGYEYTRTPPDDGFTRERLEFLVDVGSTVVVGHHPHVAQGFQYVDESLIAHSLGNFAFDQERLETTMGIALETDLRNSQVTAARMRGVFIEGFMPKEMSGYLNERFVKRISYSSLPFGTRVVPWQDLGFIVRSNDPNWRFEDRTVHVSFAAGENGSYLDLRDILDPGESIASIEFDHSMQVSPGEDLLWFGDMEDHDVDEDLAEQGRWYVTGGSSFGCNRPRRDFLALCSTRNERSQSASLISFRNRIRVLGDKLNQPNKDLSSLFYVKGENAGPVEIEAEYSASFGGKDFGRETIAQIDAGDYDWTPLWSDLNLPEDTVSPPDDKPFDAIARIENARAARLFFSQKKPARGHSLVALDDVALVSWLPAHQTARLELETPHNFDFFRIEGPPTEASVVVRRWVPK